MAVSGQDGLARAIDPVHQYVDGDVVFTLATGERPVPDEPVEGSIRPGPTRPLQLNAIFAAGADTVCRAIVHAAIAATSAGGMTSYLDRFPSARIDVQLRSPPCDAPVPRAGRRSAAGCSSRPPRSLSIGAVADDGVGDHRPGGRSRRRGRRRLRHRADQPRHHHTRPERPSISCSSTTSTRRWSSRRRTARSRPASPTLEISEDRLTYTLTLQDGVTFHDGDPLTASDVVWTLDAATRRRRLRGAPDWRASSRSRRPTTRPS